MITSEGSVIIREERPGDRDGVRSVLVQAFETPAEATLVEKLRQASAVTLGLVAEAGGGIVGHVLFSPLVIHGPDATREAVALGPMAVVPGHQGRGIGTRLVQDGLGRLRAAGHGAVVVLGHPWFYPRFGFVPASRFGVRWEHDAPEDAFMAMELVPGVLAGGGVARYRPEFDGV